MNKIANRIKQRLSLREPLCEALDVVAEITDKLSLEKPPVVGEDKDCTSLKEFLNNELNAIREVCPSFKSFDRDFTSLAFSIATGVGKTRLMAAFIVYLYLKKGIKHFFITAPNRPIYEKLIKDFGNTSYSKYVFKGITEFAVTPPLVLYGDNYKQVRNLFSEHQIQINIFNIDKFNTDSKNIDTKKSDTKKSKPKMKAFSEYLGQSYYEYLSGLNDLVVLMDEAHHYHASASKKAINELRPILGLELTATPYDDKKKVFRNIVYQYNLAQALIDGKYVKDPCIAKRSNIEKNDYSASQLEVIKLEDAISAHELTKAHLEIYAKDNNVPYVKPFVLVVCKDTTHAAEVANLIENDLFNGRYKGKVMQMDSSTKKEMSDIELKQFEEIERNDNSLEIVIHVDMLKEGWDVNNLYTIVPLRAANAITLIEQTIGRGLRLPYNGKRTGVKEVDLLTVIVHENFEKVLKEAKNPESVLSKVNYVDLDEEPFDEKPIPTESKTIVEENFDKEEERIKSISDELQKKVAQQTLNAERAVYNILPLMGSVVSNKAELSSPEVKAQIKQIATEYISKSLEGTLFAETEKREQVAKIDEVIDKTTSEFQGGIIEIPRVVISDVGMETIYEWFDLDTSFGFNLPSLEQEILRMGIISGDVDIIAAESSYYYKNPVETIIIQMMDFDEIYYDENSELLYHLAEQAVAAIKSNLSEENDIAKVVFEFKIAISNEIFRQMRSHFSIISIEGEKPTVYAYDKIYKHNLPLLQKYGYKNYKDVVKSADMKKTIFTGYEKSCHPRYKFDSTPEVDFSFVLENLAPNLVKWLRPTKEQFHIYWNKSSRYEPDFIVECNDMIYMIEIKRHDMIDTNEVQAKRNAAERYCAYASEYTIANGGKPWKYVIIEDFNVSRTKSFDYIIAKGLS